MTASGLGLAVVRTVQWTFAGLAALGVAQIAAWALDRTPSFQLVHVFPAIAVPGQSVVLTMEVRRDVARHCSVSFNRWIYDGKNVRIDLEGRQQMSAAAIENLDARAPRLLTVSVPIPTSAFPGEAELVSDLDYVCNPLQVWWPINVVMRAPFEIVSRDKLG